MARRAARRLLAIDTDPGIDDALALMWALRSPLAQLELVTTVAGNVPLAVGTANAQRVLGWVEPGSRMALHRGADGPLERDAVTAEYVHAGDGLGGVTELRDRFGERVFVDPDAPPVADGGIEALVDLAIRRGRRLTIVAIGPLTNVALALERNRTAMEGIGRLVVMGGAAFEHGNVTPAAEFNFHADPAAAERVLASEMRVLLVPLDVTHRVRLTRALVAKILGQRRDPQAKLLRALHGGIASHVRRAGMPLHDPLAVMVACRPSLVKAAKLHCTVETGGTHTAGMLVVDRRTRPHGARVGRKVDVALEVDAPAALALFARDVAPRD